MVFSGCPVANGKCKGVVVATGMDTRIGEIAKMMASEDKEVALGRRPPKEWGAGSFGP